MRNRLAHCFQQTKAQGRAALVTFVTAGDPTYDYALSILKGLPDAGADIIELGMPFSDPMADGPAIQKANIRALEAGQTMTKTLSMVAEFRRDNIHTPIVLMGYFNPIHSMGVDLFCQKAFEAGVDGLIVVDVPTEHDNELCVPAQKMGLDFIRLVTPTTREARLVNVLKNGSGFVYYVSVAGVTGAQAATDAHIQSAMETLKQHTPLPICVGFGIRTPEQVASVAQQADGVVVGSAFIDLIEQAASPSEAVAAVLRLCRQLANATRKP